MQKVTLKEYAKKHKLSLFNVMKMIKSGQVTSEEVEIDGKKSVMIILDDENEKEITEAIVRSDNQDNVSLQTQILALKQELKEIRQEIETLKSYQ